MNTKITYSEKLKDPRWQKRRLEIMQLDNFRCRGCETKERTLHVHHKYYIKGREPWEYEDDALITYCELCHERVVSVDWKRAFQDLNMSEFDLLDLAASIAYKLKKHDELMKDVHEKHKCRNLWWYMAVNILETAEEVDEYYTTSFKNEFKAKYNAEAVYRH